MCYTWTVAATDDQAAITVSMGVRDTLDLRQNEHCLVLAPPQLSELADKLFFLDQVYRANLQDAVGFLAQETAREAERDEPGAAKTGPVETGPVETEPSGAGPDEEGTSLSSPRSS